MKKIIALALFSIACLKSWSQDKDIFKAQLAAYFKTSPFGKTKDSLLKELQSDPDFFIDTLIYSSSNSGFYVRSFYKSFNPFSQKMSKVFLIVQEDSPGKKNKKIRNQKDKGLTFQIVGLTDSSQSGKAVAILADDSIHYHLNQYYPKNTRTEAPAASGYDSYTRTYFRAIHPQITTGVGKCMPDSKSYGIIIRLDLGFIVN